MKIKDRILEILEIVKLKPSMLLFFSTNMLQLLKGYAVPINGLIHKKLYEFPPLITLEVSNYRENHIGCKTQLCRTDVFRGRNDALA